jgi:hypothetical protein
MSGEIVKFRPRKKGPARVRPDLDDLNRLLEMGADIAEMVDACGHAPEFQEALRAAGLAAMKAGKLGLADIARFVK